MRAGNLVDILLEGEDIDWSPDPEDPDASMDTSRIKPPPVERFSSIKPGDGFNAPLRIALHPAMREGEWVTHVQNMENKGYAHGNYFMSDYDKAVEDYIKRCQKYGVEPL